MIFMTKLSGVSEDPYQAHKVLKSVFPGTDRALFLNSYGRLKVVSSVRPATENDYDGNQVVASSEQVAEPKCGDIVPFKVLCNPTRSARLDGVSKKMGIGDPDEAKAWLVKVLENGGAKVIACAIEPKGLAKFTKDNGISVSVIQHFAIGALEVKDAEAFKSLLLSGIGSAKFAGFGMIDIW